MVKEKLKSTKEQRLKGYCAGVVIVVVAWMCWP